MDGSVDPDKIRVDRIENSKIFTLSVASKPILNGRIKKIRTWNYIVLVKIQVPDSRSDGGSVPGTKPERVADIDGTATRKTVKNDRDGVISIVGKLWRTIFDRSRV